MTLTKTLEETVFDLVAKDNIHHNHQLRPDEEKCLTIINYMSQSEFLGYLSEALNDWAIEHNIHNY